MASQYKKFSEGYPTFENWLSGFKGSETYRNRIVRLHSKYPQASLSQLRGHPKVKERVVSVIKPKPVYKRSWSSLLPKDKEKRVRALRVLSRAKNEKLSLTKIAKDEHTTVKSVMQNTGAFNKIRGKWIPKKYDRISRSLIIYENGREILIEVTDSRYASLIGKYHNAVKSYLETGNADVLRAFKNRKIRDTQSNIHFLETNPQNIEKIIEAQEEPEFFEIYAVR